MADVNEGPAKAESRSTSIDPRWLRQVLLPEIGPVGQAQIARAAAPVLASGRVEAALAHEVAERYARGAGFGELVPGALDLAALAPDDLVSSPAAREVLAGSRAALAAIRAAIEGPAKAESRPTLSEDPS